MTLDIRGKFTTNAEIRLRVGAAVILLASGVFFSYLLTAPVPPGVPSDGERGAWYFVCAFFSFLLAPFLPSCSERAYLDFAERSVITVKNYAWHKTIKNRRPLTDFSHIVVRHLCHPAYGEGPDTFTGSVGLKPLDGSPVLWVKDFDTSEDEVPPAAEEFARRLQKLTGVPLSGLWIGDPGFADRLHQGGYPQGQVRPTSELHSTPFGMNQASSGSRLHGR
jgi:hypothetical protein